MNFMLWIAEKFGFFEKLRLKIQGAKTYLINTIQALGGVIALLAMVGQVIDLVAKSLSVLTGWGDGGQSSGQGIDAIKIIWANHAALALGFSAAFYSITDAFSKMASYAASKRRNLALIAVAQAITVPPAENTEVKP
jgi:hypothetical protein